MPEAFLLVTTRREKVEEARRLGFRVEQRALDLPEPQSLDPAAIVTHKASVAWDLLKRPVLVEDSALSVTAWGGFPGALVKWLERSAGLASFARMLDAFPDRSAVARCALCYFDGATTVSALGEVAGTIADSPRGSGGFGWDTLFVPNGGSSTFAEMRPGEKDAISHRRRAWESLSEQLSARGLL